jgi:uncharacterized protein (DUF58 family)
MAASDIGTIRVDLPYLMRMEFRTRGISFQPRQPHGSVLAGRHASRLRGRGLNFEELRDYLPGDDPRTIDWKVTLRTGLPHVRAYTDERDRPALFVVDQRMTMFFGTRRAMKSVVAAELAAIGMWMAFAAGDRSGALVFNDSRIAAIRPHRSRKRIQHVCSEIVAMNSELAAESAARTDYSQLDEALAGALNLAAHDHLVVVISDFAGSGERTQRLLRQLSAHNDVVAILVFDPAAKALARDMRIVVSGGDLQVELDLAQGRVREPIERYFSGRLENIGDLLRRSGVPLMAVDTEGETLDQFRGFLGRLTSRRHG